MGTQPRLIPTSIAIEVPRGYDVQIRPRSGLSAKGVGVTFGTIDSDYRGEILITMYLFNPNATFEIKHGDRIVQMVISKVADLPWSRSRNFPQQSAALEATARRGSNSRHYFFFLSPTPLNSSTIPITAFSTGILSMLDAPTKPTASVCS